jgi:hypothetical protein
MKLRGSREWGLSCLTLLAGSLQAAEPAPRLAESAAVPAAVADAPAASSTTAAVITPRLFAFGYFKGADDGQTSYLERYDYLESWSGDTRSGGFADFDLDVTTNNGERDQFVFERRGFGQNDDRNAARYSSDALNVYGTYSRYRSATGGIDYLFSPGQVAGGTIPHTGGGGGGGGSHGGGGAGWASTFNDDANRYDYIIDRTTYSAGFKVKPAVLGGSATVSVDYEGYTRDGNKFAPILLGEYGNVQGSGWGQDRWRGINLDVDEHMNRVGLTLTASPRQLFELAYEASFEEFINDAPELQLQRDITDPAGVSLPPAATASDRITPILYTPDTHLVKQGLKISKNFSNRVMVAAGYGASWLTQDSYSQLEQDSGHTRGQVNTNNAYLTANGVVSPDVSVEGHIKYYTHANGSTYPDGLINANTLVGPRIDRIESHDYGLSANWRPDFLASNLTLGWRRLDLQRDLTWGTPGQSILPPQSLYRDDSLSDEVYLKWIARPAKGWTTRLTPSFIRADTTGLVSEPGDAFKIKAMASYASPDGWLVSGFYDYKSLKNRNNTFTDGSGVTPPQTYNQDVNNTLNSAGLSLNLMPRDTVNVQANLYWMQNDFSGYLFTTNVQRWDPTVAFTPEDVSNCKVNTYVFNLGGDWQASDKFKLTASYTLSTSSGDVASGIVLAQLQAATGTVDSAIDNTLHTVSLGGDYLLNDKTTLRVNYIYENYNDNAYDLLDSGYSMLAIGVSFAM